MRTNETVLAMLERLPDDGTIEDVQYHLYMTQAIAAGLAHSEAGRAVPHEHVEAELQRKWLTGSKSKMGLVSVGLARRSRDLHQQDVPRSRSSMPCS